MLVSKILYTIREKIKAYSDDSRYSNEYLLNLVDMKRAFLIRREYNNPQRNIDTDIQQNITMALEEVGESLSPDFAPLDSGLTVISTVNKVPNTIELHNKNTITRIGPVGIYDEGFQIVEARRFPVVGEGKYERKYVYATTMPDNKIYLKGEIAYYKGLDYILVSGVYEHPLEVAASYDYNGVLNFDYLNFDYPIEAWMLDPLVELIIQDMINKENIPVDKINDSTAAED